MYHFPFHINDFSRDTARFELVEIGIYLRLMMEYYSSEKPLPNDHNELAFRVGARTRPEKCALDHVLRRCFELDSVKNEYVQKRCEAEILDYRAAGVQSRYANLCRHWEKVNKGVEKPKFETFAQNPDSYFEETTGRVRQVTGRKSLVLVSESEDSPNLPLPDSQPRTNNQEPITIGSPIVPKGTIATGLPKPEQVAEAIYGIYPRKAGRGAALKAIEKALKRSGLTELEMQVKVREFAKAVQLRLDQDPTFSLNFVPHPQTWFNQERYMDDPAEWSRMNSPASKPGSGPQKKEGGASGDFSLVPEASGVSGPPEGWERAMVALWGEAWRDVYAAWEMMPPSDHAQVRKWLAKKERGGE
jgi:uncharacterized protein YdaU (DUF1376 family)